MYPVFPYSKEINYIFQKDLNILKATNTYDPQKVYTEQF